MLRLGGFGEAYRGVNSGLLATEVAWIHRLRLRPSQGHSEAYLEPMGLFFFFLSVLAIATIVAALVYGSYPPLRR